MTRYVYRHEVGLGAHHADGDLTAEMRELDLHPGTEVTVAGHDTDRDLVLVEWTDRSNNRRLTSVDPAVFAEHFEGVA